MARRELVLRSEYVATNKVKCEVCGLPAYATHYDKGWEAHDFCEQCLPEAIESTE